LIGGYENEASRSHSGCDTEQSGEAVKSTELLFILPEQRDSGKS
jgi:hypothetical protein